MSEEKIFLNCPFDDKDECKSLGGKWDGDARKWYITDDMEAAPFEKWIQGDTSPAPVAAAEEESQGEKTYLNCPFGDKDECKSLGGRWDGDVKKWYVPAGVDIAPFAKWID